MDNLDAALEGKQILIPPNSPSHGVRVAFILDDGAPIELLEYHEAPVESPLDRKVLPMSPEWTVTHVTGIDLRELVGMTGFEPATP